MGKRHLTVELVRLWLAGHVDDRELFTILLSHVVLDCPVCDSAWSSATQGRIPGRGLFQKLQLDFVEEGLTSNEAIEKTITLVLSMKEAVLQSASAEALEKRLDELLRLSKDEALRVVGVSRSKYVHPRLAEMLLDRCQRIYGCTPDEKLDLAERAEAIARRVRDLKPEWRPFAVDLHALSVALQGSAYRLLGDYDATRERLKRSQLILDHGSGDPIVFADILLLRVALLQDEYCYDDAIRETRVAIRMYERCGDVHRAGRALMKLSLIYSESGDPGKAVEFLREAQGKLDFSKEPQLEILVFENLALFLSESGDPHRALEVLAEHPLDPRRNRHSLLKREWIEARIQTVLGENGPASATLANLKDEFARLNDSVSTDIVSLDLALVFAEMGLPREVKRVAEEVLPLLQTMGVPQEIWATLLLFKQAVDAEKATVAVIQSLRVVVADRRKWRGRVVEN